MSVTLFAKSTPFLIGSGVLGVGGIGITIWQTLSSTNPSLISEQEDRRGTDVDLSDDFFSSATSLPQLPNDNEIRPIVLDDASLSYITSNPSPTVGFAPSFRLGGHGCFRSFFPNVRISEHDEYSDNDRILTGKTKDELLVKAPESIESGNIKGCTIMNLSHLNDRFVFTSETIIKNDRVALALGTGIRGNKYLVSTYKGSMNLRISQYLTFLENDKSKNKWVFRGGYSGTPEESNLAVKSLTIKSPGGTSINKTFDVTNLGGATKGEHDKYSAVGEPSSSSAGNQFFKLNDENYNFRGSRDADSKLALFSNELRGYKEANRFYELDNSNWGYWRRRKESNSGFSEIKLDVGDSIRKWYKPFENSKGSGKSLKEYCKSGSDGICKGNWY